MQPDLPVSRSPCRSLRHRAAPRHVDGDGAPLRQKMGHLRRDIRRHLARLGAHLGRPVDSLDPWSDVEADAPNAVPHHRGPGRRERDDHPGAVLAVLKKRVRTLGSLIGLLRVLHTTHLPGRPGIPFKRYVRARTSQSAVSRADW